ncbi:DUF2793 domain-containing protein [Sphingorhabdus pulchriflava]|uniref:DUF2793 domain-containing protein n=1 Tax=Sphingorhabdus pulchriflava TaxID=2292257 RepID=UPI0015F17430|nr:DUF2793 domain-containing protein [Sphingorhabdus pulchriflava]
MSDATFRFALPHLHVAQAQKETTYNEALLRIDGLLHCAVQDELQTAPNATPAESGKMWLIGGLPTGEWQGRAGMIAYWTGSAWRYFVPQPGMEIWHIGAAKALRFINNDWQSAQPVLPAAGGSVVDIEVRSQMEALIGELRAIGLLPS